MRKAVPENLKSRLQSGFQHTIFLLPQEVRLCAVWTALIENEMRQVEAPVPLPSGEGGNLSLPKEERHPEAIVEACQRACLAQERCGYELRDGEAKLFTNDEALAIQASWSKGELRQLDKHEDSAGERVVYLCERVLVSIGFEVFRESDAFPGADLRVERGLCFGQLRRICLEEGFGGFAFSGDTAYFRTASAEVLSQRLVKSPGCDFYILKVEELVEEGCVSPSSPSRQRRPPEPPRAALLAEVLPRLFSPKAAQQRTRLNSHTLQGCRTVSCDDDDELFDELELRTRAGI